MEGGIRKKTVLLYHDNGSITNSGVETMNWLVQLINGLAFSSLLFLLSSGFTLIFGLMRTLNLTHGTFYALGGHVGLTTLSLTGNFMLAVLAAGVAMATLGLLQYESVLKQVSKSPLNQILLTLGLSFIYDDLILVIWKGFPYSVRPPQILTDNFKLGSFEFPKYRFVLILVGVVVAAALWFIIEKTKIGALVRAGVDDGEVAKAMGLKVRKTLVFTFCFGSFLAGAAGILGGPLLSLDPSTSSVIQPLALAVVIVGGLGSLKGAMLGSLFVGLIDNFGRVFFPDLAYFTLFAPMVILLIFRPQGLLGRK